MAMRLAARGTARTTSTPERFCRGGPRLCLRSDPGIDCWARDARRKASRATDVKGESAARCASCRTRAVEASANARQGDDARPRSLHVYYLGHGLLGRAAGLGRATDGPCARLASRREFALLFARAALPRVRQPIADAARPFSRLRPLDAVDVSPRRERFYRGGTALCSDSTWSYPAGPRSPPDDQIYSFVSLVSRCFPRPAGTRGVHPN